MDGKQLMRFDRFQSKTSFYIFFRRSDLKPRPNDRDISTKHVPTFLAHHLQAPAKRSQQFNTTYSNIVGRNMLRALGQPVVMCCDIATCWVLKIELVRMPRGATLLHKPGQTTKILCNIHKRCIKKFDQFQYPTCRNTSKHGCQMRETYCA